MSGAPPTPTAPAAPPTWGGQPNYIPTGQSSVDTGYQSLLSGMTGAANALPGQVLPGAQAATSAIQNNPYNAAYQTAVGSASGMDRNTLAPQTFAAGQTLTGMSNAASPYAAQLLQTGFDPQQQLYDKLRQQNTDQVNAMNAMYGTASSPYGAGVADQSNQNFNMNWQNQQLARQTAAASGYGNLLNSVGQGYVGGAALTGQGIADYTNAAAAPMIAYNAQQNTDLGALNALSNATGGAYAMSQPAMAGSATYLGLGQNASSVSGNLANQYYGMQLAGQQAAFNQNQSIFGDIGSLLGGVGGMFSGGGGSAASGIGSLFGGGGGGAGGALSVGSGILS